MATKRNPTNQFESARYAGFGAWQKVFFWLGVLSFLNATYWLVRLIMYLVLKEKPLKERVDAYALQTLVFGAINAAVLVLLLVIGALLLLFLVPVAVTTTY